MPALVVKAAQTSAGAASTTPSWTSRLSSSFSWRDAEQVRMAATASQRFMESSLGLPPGRQDDALRDKSEKLERGVENERAEPAIGREMAGESDRGGGSKPQDGSQARSLHG